MARLVQSIFWLTAFTGVGYSLLVGITQTSEDIKQIRKDLPGVEKNPKNIQNQKQTFVNILDAAAKSEKPFYRLTKEEIEQAIKR